MVESTQKRITLRDIVAKEPKKLKNNIALWSEFMDISEKYKCVSMGQGAPDWEPPAFLTEEMLKAIQEGNNQYDRVVGNEILVKKIAEVYGPKLGREIDPMTEVCVAHGANGALNNFINAYINAGDELVTFEPMFPPIAQHVSLAGGKINAVALQYKEGSWKFDTEALRAAVSRPECKVLLVNTPQNPTGKVFTREEIQAISDILDDYPHILVLADEVYEMLTYDDRTHVPFSTVGNNWDRTVSVYSGGKFFNATGWKIGWAIGPKELILVGGVVVSASVDCVNVPGQVAMARALDKVNTPGYHEDGKTYKELLKHRFEKNRDFLTKELQEMDIPWKPLVTEGGYFLIADISECRSLIPEKYLTTLEYEDDANPVGKYAFFKEDGSIPLDLAFCRWMAHTHKTVMMPICFFYSEGTKNLTDNFVRLTLCKNFENLSKCIPPLKNIKSDK